METKYDCKFEEIKKYIPFLESMMKRLENSSIESNRRQAQLDKIRALRDLLLGKKKRMTLNDLFKCEQVLDNLYAKFEQRDRGPKDEADEKATEVSESWNRYLNLVSDVDCDVLKLQSVSEEILPEQISVFEMEKPREIKICLIINTDKSISQKENCKSIDISDMETYFNKENNSNQTELESKTKEMTEQTHIDCNIIKNTNFKAASEQNNKDINTLPVKGEEEISYVEQEKNETIQFPLKNVIDAIEETNTFSENHKPDLSTQDHNEENIINKVSSLFLDTSKNKKQMSPDIKTIHEVNNESNLADKNIKSECKSKSDNQNEKTNVNCISTSNISTKKNTITMNDGLDESKQKPNPESPASCDKEKNPNDDIPLLVDTENISKIDILQALRKEIIYETSRILGTESVTTHTTQLHTQPKITKVVNVQEIGTKKKISIECYRAKSNSSTKSKTFNDTYSNMTKDGVTRKQSLKLTEECNRFISSKLSYAESSDNEDLSKKSLHNIYCNLAPKSPDHEDFADTGLKPPVIIPIDPVKTTVVSSEADINTRKLVSNLQMNDLICNTSISPSYCKEELLKVISTEKELIKSDKPLLDLRIKRVISRVPESYNPYLINANNMQKRYGITYTSSTLNLNKFQIINTDSPSISNPNVTPTRVSMISPNLPTSIPQLTSMSNLTSNMTPITMTSMAQSMTLNARTYDMTLSRQAFENDDFSHQISESRVYNENQQHQWKKHNKNQLFWEDVDNCNSSVQRNIDYIDPSSSSIQINNKILEQYQLGGSRNDRFMKDSIPSHSLVRLECPATPITSFERLVSPSTPAPNARDLISSRQVFKNDVFSSQKQVYQSIFQTSESRDYNENQQHQWAKHDTNLPLWEDVHIRGNSVQRDVDYRDPRSNYLQRDNNMFEQYQIESRNYRFIKDSTTSHSFVRLECPATPNASFGRLDYPSTSTPSFRRMECPSTLTPSFGGIDCPMTPIISFGRSERPRTPSLHPHNHHFNRYKSFHGTTFIRPDFSQAFTKKNYGKPQVPRLTRRSESDNYYVRDDDRGSNYFQDRNINKDLYDTEQSNCHSSSDHYRKFQRKQSVSRNETNKNYIQNVRNYKEFNHSFNRDFESDHINSKNRGFGERNYEFRYQNKFKKYDHYEQRNSQRQRSIGRKESTCESFSRLRNRDLSEGRTFHKENNVFSNRYAGSFTTDTSVTRTFQSTKIMFTSSLDALCQRAASEGRIFHNDCRKYNDAKNTISTSTKKEQNSKFRLACSEGREIENSKIDFKDIKEDSRSFKLKENIMFSKGCEKMVDRHRLTEVKKTYDLRSRKEIYDNSKSNQNNTKYSSNKDNINPIMRRKNFCDRKKKHRDDYRSYSNDRKNYDKMYRNDNISKANILGSGYGVKNFKTPKIKRLNSPERALTETDNIVNGIDVEDTRDSEVTVATPGDDNSHENNVLDKVGVPVITSQSTLDSTTNCREINEDVDSQYSVPNSTNDLQCEMNSVIMSTHSTTETLKMKLSESSPSHISSAEIETFIKLLSILQDKRKIKKLLDLLGDSSSENKKIKKHLKKLSEIASDDEYTMSENNNEKINDVKNNSFSSEIVVNENSQFDIDVNDKNTINTVSSKEELVNLNVGSRNTNQEKDRSTSEIISADSLKNAVYNDHDDTKKNIKNDTKILEPQEIASKGGQTRKRNYKFNTAKKRKEITTKSVSTEGKRLTRSSVANLRFEKSARKKPTELQILLKDLKQMFLNKKGDILSTGATGIRTCRLAKLVDHKRNQNDKQTETGSHSSQSTSEEISQIDTSKKKRHMKGRKTPIDNNSSLDTGDKLNKESKLNKSSINTNINFKSKEELKDTKTNRLEKTINLVSDIKSFKSQNQSAVSKKSFGTIDLLTEAKKKIKRKRVSKGWKAGIIKSKNRKNKKGCKKKSKSSSCEVIESQSIIQAPADCFTDKTNCIVKSQSCYDCCLCTYRGKEIVTHYKQQHPHSEIDDTSDIKIKQEVIVGQDILSISNDLQIEKDNQKTSSKDQVKEEKSSNDIFDYPHFKIKYTGTGSKEYVCCIKGNFHYTTHLLISLKKHVQLKHSEVWDGFCFMCKAIVTPQGVYHFKDCLQHFLDKHDNFPIFEEVISEPNALNNESDSVCNENLTALTSYIKVRPLSELTSQTLHSSQSSVENRLASPIIESVVSLGSEIEQSSLSPSYPSRDQTVTKKPYKYEEVQAEAMSKKHRAILYAMMSNIKLVHIFKCSSRFCSFTTDSVEDALVHVSTHTQVGGVDSLNCVYCDYDASNNAIDLIVHIFKIHGRCPYVCNQCFYRAITVQLVYAHIKRLHEKETNQTEVLHTSFQTDLNTEDYMLSRDEAVQFYVCTVGRGTDAACKYKTYIPGRYSAHLRLKHGSETEFSCFTCSMKSSTPYDLVVHMKTHALNLYQCTRCVYGSDSVAEFLAHSSSDHPDKVPKFYLRIIINKVGTKEFRVLPLAFLSESKVKPIDVGQRHINDNPVKAVEICTKLEKLFSQTVLMTDSISNVEVNEPISVLKDDLQLSVQEDLSPEDSSEMVLHLKKNEVTPPSLSEQINTSDIISTPVIKSENEKSAADNSSPILSEVVCLDSDEQSANKTKSERPESKTYPCPKCPRKLNSLVQLQKHEKIVHSVISVSQPNMDTHVNKPTVQKGRKRSLGSKDKIAVPPEKINKCDSHEIRF